ncbi:MAG TPA: class F sortase [Candidatus Paceibacterota bacterium]|nr:class F sortase [Candidatus Paceibacterota bacterium]
MSEKPLLLYSAKTGVLSDNTSTRPSHWWRTIALGLGVLAILVGAADVFARISRDAFGENASFMTFAPAAALVDPSLLNNPQPATTTQTVAVPIIPARITIPALGVDAGVESVGKKVDGSMGTPSKWNTVAWYKPGSKPGGQGNAVFAGHVNNALTTAGVFEHLSQIKIGNRIEVSDAAGQKLVYEVSEINQYSVNGAPTGAIFSTEGSSQIVLITCDGNWDASAHEFDKRLVVVARLLPL